MKVQQVAARTVCKPPEVVEVPAAAARVGQVHDRTVALQDRKKRCADCLVANREEIGSGAKAAKGTPVRILVSFEPGARVRVPMKLRRLLRILF
jgi:hypothetical protein